ncbi:MAG: M24 family metallopeptidase [Gemmatimonadetes bacterium]|nr:aminopeptidase P family protein [Gemmatimonadota bacterium]NIQ54230.1 aminopeptidase P family protein [Gemmatimonadota bacterium]NIU74438.1 M24 family metallopeptidase [Gammaproteobacteria bacterium]NIX44418.1 M24 family metallopeptidase [Gemmatimonadota bacterium]NIY08640.1 M24 family metallopeptidase [Gemmatimonadota bacterium]
MLRPGGEEPFTLFLPDRDPDRELWTGPRDDIQAVAERTGADAAHPVDALEDALPTLLRGVDRIYFRLGTGRGDVESLVLEILGGGRAARQRSGRGPAELADPGLILDDMRLVKEPAEIDAIRDAVRITIAAFRDALPLVRPGTGEWQVEAAVEAAFRDAGADGPAFATIAASGPNATILHYTANDRTMQAGDLLLLDAGARHRIYNADLTRTVPVGGRLDGPRRDVHHAVRDARQAAIDAVRPGATTDDVHRAALDVLVPAMVELGLLDGRPADLVHDDTAWKRCFPHNTSHWLGLDVHDVGTYAHDGEPRPLEPGMVLTVEPGLYVPPHADDAPAPLRGIGVRIEDDVLVTADGREVLSAELESMIDNR